MKLTKYQELFVNQDSLFRNDKLNLLSGKASFSGNVDFDSLDQCLRKYIAKSTWSYLYYDDSSHSFRKSENLNGEYLSYFREPTINLKGSLWEIQLYPEQGVTFLHIHLHHALADAHSFSLFWSGLHRAFIYNDFSEKLNYKPLSRDYSKSKFNLSKSSLSRNGIGPITRIKVPFNNNNSLRVAKKARSQKLNLFPILIHHLLSNLEPLAQESSIAMKPGLALRNRTTALSKNCFFPHVNFLPLNPDSLESIEAIQKEIRRLFRSQNFPLIELLNESKVDAAFNVLISYQKENFSHDWGADVNVDVEFLPSKVDENILSLHIIEYGDNSLKFFFDCRTDLIHQIAWRSMIKGFIQSLAFWLSDKDTQIVNKRYAVEYTQRRLAKPIKLFELFLSAPGNKTAIVYKDSIVGFDELQSRVIKISKKYKAGQVVSITPDRNIDIIVSILACWYAGAISTITEKQETYPVALYDENPILYIATTTGTSGLPKKVAIRKKGIELLMSSWNTIYNCQDSVHLSIADTRFDVFYGDLCRSLLLGNTLVLTEEADRLNSEQVARLINRHSVTHLEITPSIASIFEKILPGLKSIKCLILGSEKLNVSLSSRIYKQKPPNAKVYNSYGLTEVSIDSAVYQVRGDEKDYIPCGNPIGNQTFRVLGKNGMPVRQGVWGELEILGEAVGDLIYENRSLKPLQSFLTGDQAMYVRNEGLIVKGRISEDFVKINGRRIPFLRIESVLREELNDERIKCAEIDSSFILFIYDRTKQDSVQAYLKKHFLPHEQPNEIVPVSKWSLNKSGKIDLNSLINQFKGLPKKYGKTWLPGELIEEQILFEFAQKENLTLKDPFESLILRGWNSLHIIRLANRFRESGFFLDVPKLMTSPSVNGVLSSLRDLEAIADKDTQSIDLPSHSMENVLSILNR